MVQERMHKLVNGLVPYGMGFLGIGYLLANDALYDDRLSGVMVYLDEAYKIGQYNGALFLAIYFIMAGLINIWTGLRNRPFNVMWFTPFFAYSFVSFIAWQNDAIPPLPVVIYGIGCAKIIIDLLYDVGLLRKLGKKLWKVQSQSLPLSG
jgi:hypothetical protein